MIGYLLLKQFLNKYNQDFTCLKNLLKDYCILFNKSIDGFKELSEDWESVYESLKMYKSDSEWINKYFIINYQKIII